MPGMEGEFIPKPPLAQSNFHHEAMGISERQEPDTPENLHRPMHEFMPPDALRAYVEDSIATVRGEFVRLRNETVQAKRSRCILLLWTITADYLFPNLRYLSAIGRLPDGIDVEALEAEFVIPRE